ncbi:MAG: hypothetical protein KGH87_06625 [Thaumarchaeota archaeon]|nr:hypothetical protein [Nitrososphaerota archaeon]
MAFVQSAKGGTASTVASFPLAFAANNGLNSLLVACFSWFAPATSVTVTDSQGNTWTKITTVTDGYGDNIDMWYAVGCKAGANTVTVTGVGGSIGGIGLNLLEYSYAATTVPTDGSSTRTATTPVNGTDAMTTGSWTTTRNGGLIVCCSVEFSSSAQYAAIAAGTGFTMRSQQDAGGSYGMCSVEDKVQSVAGSVAGTMSYTGGAAFTSPMIAAAFKFYGLPVPLSPNGLGAAGPFYHNPLG